MNQVTNSEGSESQTEAIEDSPSLGTMSDDLKAFIGPNADKFAKVWVKMGTTKKPSAIGWSWPAFLLGFVWFLYRKMYIAGGLLLLIPMVLALMFPDNNGGSIGLAVCLGMLGKSWYLASAKKKIVKINERVVSPEDKAEQIAQAGGVSVPMGIVGGLIYTATIALAIYAIYLEQ